MTPDIKTKFKNAAQVRTMSIMNVRALSDQNDSYTVEGYAAKYEPYELYRYNEKEVVIEQFTRQNFEDADKSDIIFQFDHAGRVYARTSNATLKCLVDEIGLKVIIDLGKTESARQIYEEIKTGMITKMSWRFGIYDNDIIVTTVEAGGSVTYMITYRTIRKIYDVSAVSIPANDNTEISARTAVEGVIIAEKARREAERTLNIRINALKNWAKGAL